MFSCEFCEISKNTFFTKHLWWLLLIPMNWKSKIIPWLNAKTQELWNVNVISNYSQRVLCSREFNGKTVHGKQKLKPYFHFVAIVVMLSDLIILLCLSQIRLHIMQRKKFPLITWYYFFCNSIDRSFRKLIVLGCIFYQNKWISHFFVEELLI